MIWSCEVWCKSMGWDCYWVSADSVSDAEAECLRRLREETDNPDEWKIMAIFPEGTDNFVMKED